MMEQLKQQFPASDFSLLAIVLVLPLLGALVNGLFGKRLGKSGVRTMALTAIGGSFLASVVTFFMVVATPVAKGAPAARFVWNVWHWFSVDGQIGQKVPIDVAFSVDALSAIMMLVVTGVGFLIHLYSTGYMAKDPGYSRFFAYLNLFIFSMLVLILGDNLAILFIGWEGVGLCSYLLIGFWYTDEQKAAAGKKAFITNRIGDFGLLVAMAMLVYYAGTLNWSGLEKAAPSLVHARDVWPIGNLHASALPTFLADWLTPAQPWQMFVPTFIGLALFLGCVGKSAQFPLYVWLPDAMAGPTPVSALIHAATMVTAGVYLVARCSFLFVLSPAVMTIIAATGAFTALLAATIALAQNDLKKVLAYSTVSQLGFMFIGVGSGAFTAGFFHVLTHAFFKGCLFLCAGSVIHAMHVRIHDDDASQDMRKMGGLRKFMPFTHITYLVSCLAIAGCPPLSGFWSKEEVLGGAYHNTIAGTNTGLWTAPAWTGKAIFAVGILAAVLTAFYMFRSYFMTFQGSFRGWKIVKGYKSKGHDHHDHDVEDGAAIGGPLPHESPWQMTAPLVILAALAAVAGLMWAPLLKIEALKEFLAGVFKTASANVPHAEHSLLPLAFGIGAFAVGTAGAFYVYQMQRGKPAAAFVRAVPWLHRGALHKWKVDELYEATVLGMVDAMGETAAQFDKWGIDGIIARVTSAVTIELGNLLRKLQSGRLQVYAAAMVIGVAGIGWYVLVPHANANADEPRFARSGRLQLTAAAGHGYRYRWHVDQEPVPAEYTTKADYSLKIGRCETKTVHLSVQNVFGLTSERDISRCWEVRNGCCDAPKASKNGSSKSGSNKKAGQKPADASKARRRGKFMQRGKPRPARRAPRRPPAKGGQR